MQILEKTIEGAVIRHAKRRGLPKEAIVKLNGIGKRSHPDRMFLYNARVLFIEFKREGGAPTPLQRHLHEKWQALGHVVHVVDNVASGKRLIDELMRLDLLHPLKDCRRPSKGRQ